MSNEEEAYLLGILLKRAVAQKQISESEENKVHEIVKKNYAFLEFYERKRKPNFNDWSILSVVVCFFGGLAIIFGSLMLFSNQYFINFSTITLTENIKGGGYLFILGLMMFIGGFIKTRQEYYRRQLLKH